MKLHVVTIGEPKLAYAHAGCQEYLKRLQHYHTVRVTHLADKWAYDAPRILEAAGNAYSVALVIDGEQFTSPGLAAFLQKRELAAKEVCLLVGGPEGLPQAVIAAADFRLSLSKLTFPHDLAVLVLCETLYRASTIMAGQPYHK